MDFYTETISRIPPLVIMNGTQFYVCGSGYDSHLWLKPEIMRRSNAFIIYDPDGNLRKKYAKTFYRNGYAVKVLNTANFKMSTRYNPFEYIRSDKDIPKFVNALINNTKGIGDPYDVNFITAEITLLTALISYMVDEAPTFEQNIGTLIQMLEYMKPEEGEEEYGYKHAVDYIFEDKEAFDPEHLSLRKYKNYYEMMGEDAWKVVASCATRLAPFNTEILKNFSSTDELGLDELYCPNTALFVMAGNTESPLNLIVPLMYTQLYDVLCDISVQ